MADWFFAVVLFDSFHLFRVFITPIMFEFLKFKRWIMKNYSDVGSKYCMLYSYFYFEVRIACVFGFVRIFYLRNESSVWVDSRDCLRVTFTACCSVLDQWSRYTYMHYFIIAQEKSGKIAWILREFSLANLPRFRSDRLWKRKSDDLHIFIVFFFEVSLLNYAISN